MCKTLRMRHMFLYIILTVNALMIHSNAGAQIAELSVTLSRDSILIGEPTELEIRVVKNKDVSVVFPSLTDTIVKGIEVLYAGATDTIRMGDEQILSRKITVTGFDSGSYYIPSFRFLVEINDVKDTIQSVPAQLHIKLPEIDQEAEFRDIKPTINTPLNFKEAFPYIIAGLGIILIIFLIVYFIHKYRKKRSGFVEKIPDVPAYITALDQLQQLRIQKAWETKNIKEYYTKLSGIVRTYLENQFGVKALELTTFEILMDFELLYGKNQEIKSKLEELLELSDLVKFAKEAPSSARNLENLDKATLFVELTKPDVQKISEELQTSELQNEV